MPFDPDKYLKQKEQEDLKSSIDETQSPKDKAATPAGTAIKVPSGSFDPDKYLQQKDIESQPPDTVAGDRLREPGAQAPASEEQPMASQLFNSVVQGIKETWTPGMVTKEEIEGQKDDAWYETAAQIAGGILADIGGAAAATKTGATIGSFAGPLGTVVGAGVGALSYALYTGIGQENLAEARGGEFSTLRAAGRAALAVNPLLRYSSKVGQAISSLGPKADKLMMAAEKGLYRAARLGAQVAGETAVAGSEFGKDGAMAASIVSLVAHGIGFKGKPTPKQAMDAGEFAASKSGIKTMARAAKRIEAMPEINTAKYNADEMTYDFANYVLEGNAPKKTWKERAARYMEHRTDKDEIYQTYLKKKIIEEELLNTAKEVNEAYKKGGKFDDSMDAFSSWTATFRDGQNAAREVDRRTGIGMTKALNDLSEARGRFETTKAILQNKAKAAYKIQKRLRISDDEMGKLRTYLSDEQAKKAVAGDIKHLLDGSGNLNPKAKKAVEAWNDVWSSARESIKSEKFDMGQRDFYFPRAGIGKYQLAHNVENFMDTAGKLQAKAGLSNDISSWSIDDLAKAGLTSVEIKQFQQESKYLRSLLSRHGVKDKKLTFGRLNKLRNSAITINDRTKTASEISATLERGSAFIPIKYREFNNRQAFLNYLNSNVKGAVMSDSIREMSGIQQSFSKANLKDSAKWVDNLLNDISGGSRTNLRQWFADKENKMNYRIYQGLNNQEKNWASTVGWNTANIAMQGFSAWQSAIYPAYLALNVPAMARNLSQNLVMTAPEIGGTYGYSLALRSMYQNPFQNYKYLKKAGILAEGAVAEMIKPEQSKFLEHVSKAGDIAMKLYTGTDTLNRMWTYNIGQTMAKDLATGNLKAIKALSKLGPSVKAALQKEGLTSLEAFRKNQKKTGDILGKMLIGKTQFHYGQEQKAEFLRNIGPLFSMFTKWPVSTASDIGTIMRENPKLAQKAYRYFERYGAIWMAFAYADSMKDEQEFTQNYFLNNLSSWAPGKSAIDLGLLNNPRVEAAMAIPGIAKKVFSAEDKAGMLKQLAREGVKSGLGPASAVINELDRIQKARGEKAPSREFMDELFD